ncbi:EamA family transporter [Endozoicomonas sp. OPT23]|uniref:DMT family transporter n=1 Tax=Endozoicomonas sp. OPT23 TaxID=2072845 RepID=UPI00129A8275|nr:DMT family transporter [Endozoicomonas sp. OPT23]MRI33830.1 EamA family transporter [Endozoicomonas sp. OPT23]
MISRFENSLPAGVRFMLLSALGFSLMTACVKLLSNQNIPVMEIVAARALVSLLLSYIDVKRKGISIWGNNKPLLVGRGVAGALALMCVYYAVSTLPLAEATLLQYLHPVFTAFLALLFLKEHIQKSTLACIIFSLCGLVLMVQPDALFGGESLLPIFSVGIALAGAFGSAVAYVIVRKLSSQKEDSSVIIFYFPLIALPLSLLLLGDDFVVPNMETLFIMVLVGIFTQMGQIGLTRAMSTESAGKATAFSYVQVLFSVLLGWIIFSEVPTLWTWVGGSLIMAGALVNVYGSMRAKAESR